MLGFCCWGKTGSRCALGWGVAGSVVHHWGCRRSWAPSAAMARGRGRGPAAVLEAEMGPWLRLQRLHGHSRGRRGWLLQESSLNNHGEPLFFFLFEKFLLFKPVASNKCLASHTAQLSNQTRDHPGQGLSWPNSSQPVFTVSAGAQCPCMFASTSLSPLPHTVTSSIQVHPGTAQTSLFGRGGSC